VDNASTSLLRRGLGRLRRGFLRANYYAAVARLRLRLLQWAALQRLPERILTVDTLRQGRLSYSTRDGVIGHALFFQREFGLGELDKTINLLRAHNYLLASNEGYLIDVGANIGTVCITLVLNGDFQRALAFEPAPYNFSLLTRNIHQNHLADRISAHQIGLSSTETELFFELAEDNYGDHRIRMQAEPDEGAFGEEEREVISVPVQSLDHTLRQLDISPQEVKLIYMDVQGHEWHVLQGARDTLAAGAPLVMEIWLYGLRWAKTDIEAFIRDVASTFTHYFDLRQDPPRKQPTATFADFIGSLQDLDVTDILLVNDPRG
jgi:FkbM family methyltransferase